MQNNTFSVEGLFDFLNAGVVSTVNAQPTKDMKFANIHISFGIPNLSMLTTVVDKIKSVPEVYSVKRTNG